MIIKVLRQIKNIYLKIYPFLNGSQSKDSNSHDLFIKQYNEFEKLNTNKRFQLSKDSIFPCLNDNLIITPFDAHYIYHPAWAARIINKISPINHVDISSTLHFSTILSAFISTEFYDYRPANLFLENLSSHHADLTNLPFESNSIVSLSCMHTIEHIGLGRYGDPLDPDGDIKAINELKRVTALNGNLLLVVPVGKQKIMFNAHRIYDPNEFLSYLDNFSLINFSLITDDGAFIENALISQATDQTYGCGCFWFKKLAE
ncbi:DUF268 domain-containing protein [Flavihumibacter sp. R14]|nr:DUF268 domain-containing protein [Flavihumibacter soli]